MARRVVARLVPAQVDARELVEEELTVGSRIRGSTVADEHGHAGVRFELQVTGRKAAEGVHGSARERGAANESVLESGAHVAHALQVLPDVALTESLVIACEGARCPGGLARPDRAERGLGRQHAGAHRVVDSLQGRDVHEAGTVADDHAARKAEAVRQGEEPALWDGLRPPGDPFPAFEDGPDERVPLELLEHLVNGERRVRVVEADDHPDRDPALAERVDEAAAELPVAPVAAQGPAHRVDDPVKRARNLPDLLDTERPDLRLRGKPELLEGDAGQVPLRALSEDRDPRRDVRPGLVVGELLPALPAPFVTGSNADEATARDEELLRRGFRHDHDPELLRALSEPAAHLAEGGHVVPVVPHGGRRRDSLCVLSGQVVDALVLDRRDQGEVSGNQVGKELPEGAGVHDRARKEVRAGRLALLEHRDRDLPQPLSQFGRLLEQLSQPDCGSQPTGPGTHDERSNLDSLVRRVGRLRHEFGRVERGSEVGRVGGHDCRLCRTSSVSFGTISFRSPTTARSEYSKIGAFGSLLIATIVPELCMPTLCWIAPEMPQAR